MTHRGGKATSGLTGTVPTPAFLAGYTINTFSSTFNNDVDLGSTLASGFKWYPYNFFNPNPPADMTKVTGSNTGGPVVLLGDTPGPNGEIMTCAVKNSSYVGTAFGGGGYFEATLKFDPTTVAIGTGNGWPSFWAEPIEKGLGPSGTPVNDQWAGQSAGLEHWIEPDFMEYIRPGAAYPTTYDGTLHDWQGTFPTPGFTGVDNTAGSSNYMPINAPYTNFNVYNKYGFLWVPATATTKGFAQYYFNHQPVGTRITWSQYVAASTSPPVSGQPWAFGVMDIQHLSIILGTGPGATLTVQDVNVWQASAANNVVQ